eukprot:COSAG01_NODE_641_length_14573_cov_17.634637_9_plen_336_part_00
MKADLHGEALNFADYDTITLLGFLLMVPGSAILAFAHKWAQHIHDDQKGDSSSSESHLKVSFQRYLRAQDTEQDRKLLSVYFDQLEDDINGSFHVFISYRVASEKDFAKALFDALSEVSIESTGQQLRVYLDQVRLKDGERWDVGFMAGLSKSWIVIPILSSEALAPMQELNGLDGDGSQTDNVLLEWIATLELLDRGLVKAIIPVVVPSAGGTAFNWELTKQLSALEHKPTVAAATTHMRNLSSREVPLSGVSKLVSSVTNTTDEDARLTVVGVVNAILRFQGVLMSDRDDLENVTERVRSKVTTILNAKGDVTMQEDSEEAAASEGEQQRADA